MPIPSRVRVGAQAAPRPAALDGRPGDVGDVEDEPAAVGGDATVLGLVDAGLVHAAGRYPATTVKVLRPSARPYGRSASEPKPGQTYQR